MMLMILMNSRGLSSIISLISSMIGMKAMIHQMLDQSLGLWWLSLSPPTGQTQCRDWLIMALGSFRFLLITHPILEQIECGQVALLAEWARFKAHIHNCIQNERVGNRQPDRPDTARWFANLFTRRFHNLLMLLEIILVIPLSTAVCE